MQRSAPERRAFTGRGLAMQRPVPDRRAFTGRGLTVVWPGCTLAPPVPIHAGCLQHGTTPRAPRRVSNSRTVPLICGRVSCYPLVRATSTAHVTIFFTAPVLNNHAWGNRIRTCERTQAHTPPPGRSYI
eukprot:5959136-Prymnesium_polylepis.3